MPLRRALRTAGAITTYSTELFRGLNPGDANIPVIETRADVVALTFVKLAVPLLTAFTLKARAPHQTPNPQPLHPRPP